MPGIACLAGSDDLQFAPRGMARNRHVMAPSPLPGKFGDIWDIHLSSHGIGYCQKLRLVVLVVLKCELATSCNLGGSDGSFGCKVRRAESRSL